MNIIADFLNEIDRNKAKRVPKPRYKKPESIKQLENDLLKIKIQRHPTVPHMERLRDNLRDDSANALTKCICKYLQLHGHFAARVNTQGNYNARLGKYVYSGSRKGMADISAVINGRHVSIEVKVGKDRPRLEQLKVKDEIEAAGGHYIFVHSFDNFLEQLEQITNIKS
jgi:hypothetical protein